MLAYEVLHREQPFTGMSPLQAAFAVAMQHTRPRIQLPSELRCWNDLLAACWSASADDRPEMREVVQAAMGSHNELAGVVPGLEVDESDEL